MIISLISSIALMCKKGPFFEKKIKKKFEKKAIDMATISLYNLENILISKLSVCVASFI